MTEAIDGVQLDEALAVIDRGLGEMMRRGCGHPGIRAMIEATGFDGFNEVQSVAQLKSSGCSSAG